MKKIIFDGKLFAIIVPSEFTKEGIEFFTPGEFSQQLGYMKRPEGYVIPPHTHGVVKREVFYTLETLFIRKGRMRVDFYSEERELFDSYVVKTGDVIMLVFGGHGFVMLEESEIIEVKQGPFIGDQDKVRF